MPTILPFQLSEKYVFLKLSVKRGEEVVGETGSTDVRALGLFNAVCSQ